MEKKFSAAQNEHLGAELMPFEARIKSLKVKVDNLSHEVFQEKEKADQWKVRFYGAQKDARDRMDIIKNLESSLELRIGRWLMLPIHIVKDTSQGLQYLFKVGITLLIAFSRFPIAVIKNASLKKVRILIKAIGDRESSQNIRLNLMALLRNSKNEYSRFHDRSVVPYKLHIDHCRLFSGATNRKNQPVTYLNLTRM